ncbi:hypothetical protein CF319_g9353 [Tilletia indica]|nr:hypothetical protein CF319_g9353 [Tilletia indica]
MPSFCFDQLNFILHHARPHRLWSPLDKKDLFTDPDMHLGVQDAKDNMMGMESELRVHLKESQRPKIEYISVVGSDFLIEVRVADAAKVPADWLWISATKSMVPFHTPQARGLLQEREQHMDLLAAR